MRRLGWEDMRRVRESKRGEGLEQKVREERSVEERREERRGKGTGKRQERI